MIPLLAVLALAVLVPVASATPAQPAIPSAPAQPDAAEDTLTTESTSGIATRCNDGPQLVPGWAVAFSKALTATPRGWGSANQGTITVTVEGSDESVYVAVLRVNAEQGARERYDVWDSYSPGQAAWYSLGGQIQGPPLAYGGRFEDGTTYLVIYVRGRYDGNIYRNVDAYGQGWSGWQYVGPGAQNYWENWGPAQLDSRRYEASADPDVWWQPKVKCWSF